MRKTRRWCICNVQLIKMQKLNKLYQERNMQGFWNMIQRFKHNKTNSTHFAAACSSYYSTIMTDTDSLNQAKGSEL